MGLVEPMTCRL